MDFRDTSLEALANAVRRGERTAQPIMRATLARIAEHNPTLNVFVALAEEQQLLDAAAAIDRRIEQGDDPGPLAGVPVAVKDLEDAAGLPTTSGSALFADAPVAEQDSIAVARLRAAGALVVGKTNTPEFGCKGVTDNPLFGATRNPWNTDYSSGGSSGGSAAALAAGLVPLATGSDGGGSIRIPAALCGFSGFKASPGRVPIGGKTPPGTGILGVRGPMARTIADTALALDVMKGDDATDIFGLPDDGTSWRRALDNSEPPARVVWAPTLGYAEIDADVLRICERAVEKLRAAGIDIIEREQVLDAHPIRAWWTLWTAGMARTLGDRVDTGDWDKIDPALQAMVHTGLKTSGTDYARALDACHRFNYQLETVFADAPLMLTPTCAGHTPRIGEHGTVNGRATPSWGEMTFGLNLTRNPAASVHAGCDSDGLPIGLQIIGRQRHDIETLCAAGHIEALLGGPGRAPWPDKPG